MVAFPGNLSKIQWMCKKYCTCSARDREWWEKRWAKLRGVLHCGRPKPRPTPRAEWVNTRDWLYCRSRSLATLVCWSWDEPLSHASSLPDIPIRRRYFACCSSSACDRPPLFHWLSSPTLSCVKTHKHINIKFKKKKKKPPKNKT